MKSSRGRADKRSSGRARRSGIARKFGSSTARHRLAARGLREQSVAAAGGLRRPAASQRRAQPKAGGQAAAASTQNRPRATSPSSPTAPGAPPTARQELKGHPGLGSAAPTTTQAVPIRAARVWQEAEWSEDSSVAPPTPSTPATHHPRPVRHSGDRWYVNAGAGSPPPRNNPA